MVGVDWGKDLKEDLILDSPREAEEGATLLRACWNLVKERSVALDASSGHEAGERVKGRGVERRPLLGEVDAEVVMRGTERRPEDRWRWEVDVDLEGG